MSYRLISIVSPVYNEEKGISEFVNCLFESCHRVEGYRFEVILVDDGSTDKTINIVRKLGKHYPIKVICFAHNCGQQEAILSGLQASNGSAVVVMDADLQDPPRYIPELIEYWEGGADVVMCARRKRGDGIFKKLSASIYYRIINLIDRQLQIDCGDYYLLDRQVVNHVISFHGQKTYLRGLIARLSKKLVIVPIDRDARRVGKGGYTLKKMFTLAKNGLLFAITGRNE